MADPAELIERVGRAIYEAYPNRHGVPYAANRDVVEPMARAAIAALTPTHSADDAAVLDEFEDAVRNYEASDGGTSEHKVSARAELNAARAAVLSRMAGKVPPGYKLVPEETNFDLTDAFCEAWEAEKERMLAEAGSYAEAQMFKVAWKALLNSSAMLAAAPEAAR